MDKKDSSHKPASNDYIAAKAKGAATKVVDTAAGTGKMLKEMYGIAFGSAESKAKDKADAKEKHDKAVAAKMKEYGVTSHKSRDDE